MTIPPPLDPDDFEIEVDLADACTLADGRGHACSSVRERTMLFAATCDVITACTPAWIRYAVPAALRGELPRTRCFVVPTLSGGVAFNLGAGREVGMPQVFGGATCRPAPWGRQCDEATPHVLPDHEALAPRSRQRIEDAGDVVFDDFESMGWPAIRAKGGAA